MHQLFTIELLKNNPIFYLYHILPTSRMLYICPIQSKNTRKQSQNSINFPLPICTVHDLTIQTDTC